jgi:hypothetical protein
VALDIFSHLVTVAATLDHHHRADSWSATSTERSGFCAASGAARSKSGSAAVS